MKQFIKAIFLLLLTLSTHTVYARLKGQARIDSLLKELASDSYRNKEDTTKVTLMGDIAYQYYRLHQPDTMLKYANPQLALARRLNWQKGIARAIDFVGMAHESKNEPRIALAYYDTSLYIYEQIDKRKAADGAFYSGVLCYNINENARAIQYFYRALKICESVGICDVEASCYTGIAVVHGTGKDFATAVEYHTKALKTADKCTDMDSVQRLQIYANLATSCQYKGDCAASLPYCFTALELAGKLGNGDEAANMNGNICLAYTKLRDYEKAIYYGSRALAISDSLRDKKHVAWSLYELGHAFLCRVTDTATASEGQKISMGSMGTAGKQAQIRTALSYLERGLDSIRGTLNEAELTVKIYEDLTKAYRLTGNWESFAGT